MREINKRREDLPHGRGGMDLYPRDWMTDRTQIPDGRLIGTKLNVEADSPYVGVRGVGGVGIGDTSADPNAPLDEPSMLDFSQYWTRVKDTFTDLEGLGYKISLKLQQLGQIRASLERQGKTDLMNAMQPDIDKVNADLQTWWTCKGYMDQYKSVWTSAANMMGLGGLGFIFIPWLTYAVLAGIVFIAAYGLSLISTYKYQTNVLDAVAAKTISPEAGATLMHEASQTTAGGILGSAVGAGVGNIAMIAGVGLAAYFLFLKKA